MKKERKEKERKRERKEKIDKKKEKRKKKREKREVSPIATTSVKSSQIRTHLTHPREAGVRLTVPRVSAPLAPVLGLMMDALSAAHDGPNKSVLYNITLSMLNLRQVGRLLLQVAD